jgi:acetaldehyde dehydrogenase (acetylating)
MPKGLSMSETDKPRERSTRGAVIIGSGNIGTDLLFKLQRSPLLHCVGVIGIDPDSEGLALARSKGVETSHKGIAGLFDLSEKPFVAFDATTARSHVVHAQVLAENGIKAIDLTPAHLGPMVVPDVNLTAHLDVPNVNLISCAAQATVPIVAALKRSTGQLLYAETVSTVASKSAGPGTRQNVDEFTFTTRDAHMQVGGADRAKAIALFNPAEPPMMMANTIYALVHPGTDEAAVTDEVNQTAERIRQFVPGYRLRGPIFSEGQVTVFVDVEGAGDYLPKYSGNLDIITAAAIEVASELARAADEQPASREVHA